MNRPSAAPAQRTVNPAEAAGTELFVLMIDDSSQHTEEMLNALRSQGHAVRPAFVQDRDELREALACGTRWDLVLMYPEVDDMQLGEMCTLVRDSGHDAVLLVVTNHDPANIVQRAMLGGAADAVSRRHPEHLQLVVRRELMHLATARSVQRWSARTDEAERRCLALLDSSRDAVAYVHDGMHVHANPAYLQLFGYQDMAEELEGLPLLDLMGAEHADAVRETVRSLARGAAVQTLDEVSALRSDGKPITVSLQFARAGFDGEPCIQITARDLSEHKHFERQLQHMRRRDPTTGLFNRRHLREELQRIATTADGPGTGALLLVELDDFDAIRRTVGITRTDALLRDLAGVIAASIGGSGLLARAADQTFAILLPGRDAAAARDIAERVRATVQAHIWNHGEHSVTSTCSVGVAMLQSGTGSPEAVLGQADHAVHAALAAGGNRVEVAGEAHGSGAGPPSSTPALDPRALVAALKDGRAAPLYRPVVNLASEDDAIYDVMLGMSDHDGRPVDGAQLCSLVEQVGAARVDAWLLGRALRDAATGDPTARTVRLFIPLSEASIRDGDTLLALLRSARAATHARVVFSLPVESATRQVRFARAAAAAMHQAGCELALSGFSGEAAEFNVLVHVDADYLLLAPQLVRDLASDEQARAHLARVGERARAAGKQTVATGVGDAQTLTLLWQSTVPMACGDYIQEASPELTFEFSAEPQ